MKQLAGKLGPMLAFAVAGLGLWQLFVVMSGVGRFLLPAPSDVAGAFARGFPTILDATRVTASAVVLGMLGGVVAGLLVALLIARFSSVAPPVLATVVVVNCAPIIALAPIFNNWFGSASLMSKAAVAGVMVFFPVLLNTARGLLEARPLHVELMTSLAARPRQVSLLLRLPGALPYLFSALRLATTLSVIGVIIAEFFGGPTNALGVYIAYQAAVPRFAVAWAGIIMASALGLGLFGVVVLLERIVMPWHTSSRSPMSWS
ncbi:ABC transporter permease [Actinopolymorpha sp. B17G11]|uniref:ABC transporter permease n=1 Tax=Actinopolymorpha sp. B17G11 TaxID=3160861 RepID=UPI0032E47819